MRDRGKIGVFDSGIGGVTVLKRINEALPNESIVYYGDTLFSPYGEKTKEEIDERSVRISKFLVEQGCKVIVIACNTATVAALEKLQEVITVPVIGIINPGSRATVTITKNKRVGVIATPFTVKNLAYTKEIKKIEQEIEVFEAGCGLFATMIEQGWNTFENRFELLEEYLSPLPKNIDTLVLGCTHYPIILEDIKKHYKGIIVDPAFETAKEVKERLTEISLMNPSTEPGAIEFYVSGDKEQFKRGIEAILGHEINEVYSKIV